MNEADALAPQCGKNNTRAHTRIAATPLALLALFSLGYWNAFIGTLHQHHPTVAFSKQDPAAPATDCDIRWANNKPAWSSCTKSEPYISECKWAQGTAAFPDGRCVPNTTAGKTVAPQLLAYTKNQLAYVNAAGNQFKASLWFFSPDGALQKDQLESTLARAICTATSQQGETVHGVFVPLLPSESDICEVCACDRLCHLTRSVRTSRWEVAPYWLARREGHPFFQEQNFGRRIAYAPGQCSFAHGGKLDSQRYATVHIPDSEFRQQVVFRLRAFPTQKPRGMAICHGPLYAGGPGKTAYTHAPAKFGRWAMHNVDYYSNSGKPGEKPVRSYVFDARDPKLRVLDPLRSTLERPEQMELIEMDIALQPLGDDTAGTAQPYGLAQLALIRECGDMAKYDGYKWAAFIDYDEYISVRGDKSIEEYTEGLPNGTVSVIIPRVPPPENISTVPERWAAEKLISFAASWVHTQAQWNVSKLAVQTLEELVTHRWRERRVLNRLRRGVRTLLP